MFRSINDIIQDVNSESGEKYIQPWLNETDPAASMVQDLYALLGAVNKGNVDLSSLLNELIEIIARMG